MSKWRKALKNKRRFDARYFLGERNEGQEEVIENSVQQEKVKRNFHDFSFDSWLTEDQDLEEAHCTAGKRDDDLEEMHCGSSKRDDDLEEAKGKYDDGDGKDEKCDYVDCEGVDEGHDGATKGHSQMSKATKKREKRPFDYEKGKIGDEVFEEESVIGKEEEEPEYGEPMEELVVPGVMPKGDGDAKGMTPEEIRMAKAKEKMDLMRKAAKGKPPVRKDVKAGLEEDLEEG